MSKHPKYLKQERTKAVHARRVDHPKLTKLSRILHNGISFFGFRISIPFKFHPRSSGAKQRTFGFKLHFLGRTLSVKFSGKHTPFQDLTS